MPGEVEATSTCQRSTLIDKAADYECVFSFIKVIVNITIGCITGEIPDEIVAATREEDQ